MAGETDKILIVGCGPGASEYVTPAAREAVRGAARLIGASRLLALFPCEGSERIAADGNVARIIDQIASHPAGSGKIVVLVSGDPGIYSLAQSVIKRFGREKCSIIPGVSAVQTAFARIGLDWIGARIVSAHGRKAEVSAAELSDEDKIAILLGGDGSAEWAAKTAESLSASHALFLCANLTLPNEEAREIAPSELRALPKTDLAIALIIRRNLL